MDLFVIWEVIVLFWLSTHTVFDAVSRAVTVYESSQMMISTQMRTG